MSKVTHVGVMFQSHYASQRKLYVYKVPELNRNKIEDGAWVSVKTPGGERKLAQVLRTYKAGEYKEEKHITYKEIDGVLKPIQ